MLFESPRPNDHILRALEKVCADPQFASSPRLARFLRFVVEQALDGHGDQLKEPVIGLEVYDRGKDYDPKTDPIVRVEARRLRKALDEYYQGEGVRDRLVIQMPKGGYVPLFETRKRAVPGWLLAAVASVLLVAALLVWRPWADDDLPRPVSPERVSRQLTTDPGLSTYPDVAADGNMLVFASDRDGGPDLDLWLRFVDRDDARQLTDLPGDEIQPDISPDGSLVVFTLTPEHAIYTVPTVGGTPRRLASNAVNPQFAPDSRRIAFWQGREGWTANLMVVDLSGAVDAVYGAEMSWLGSGTRWLPDGTLLSNGIDERRPDWWVVPEDGSPPARAGLVPRLGDVRPARNPPVAPQAWLEPEQAVLFSASLGDSIGIFGVPFSLEEGRVVGDPFAITRGGGIQNDATTTRDGRIIHSDIVMNHDLWRVPFDPRQSRITGPAERLTSAPSAEWRPSVSSDGKTVLYRQGPSSRNYSRSQIKIASAEPFEERDLLRAGARPYRTVRFHPAKNAAVFEMGTQADSAYYEAPLDGGPPRLVCSDCGTFTGAVSPDGRFRIHLARGELGPNRGEGAYHYRVYDDATGDSFVWVRYSTAALFAHTRFSPDGKWVAFAAPTAGPFFNQVYIAPFEPGREAIAEEWIAIGPPDTQCLTPEWGPAGERLYYISNQDGPYAIWAQPLGADTMRPEGPPIRVYDRTADGASFGSILLNGQGPSRFELSPDAIYFHAPELKGNLWMLEPR